MAEPFKNQINVSLIERMGTALSRNYDAFDRKHFVKLATDGLDSLELKARSLQIVQALEATLPTDFGRAAMVLEASLGPKLDAPKFNVPGDSEEGIAGWGILAVQEYVGRRGLGHLEVSMHLFKELTQRLTSEFGIRPFLDQMPEQTLAILGGWVFDPSEHVRRLVSEGTRPRLPWGMQLKGFITDPMATLPLLEALKDDSSEYVRRSVANHLNDIAKDHPDFVCEVASRWWKDADVERQKTIRHALRTLVKQGHKGALAILGYETVKVSITGMRLEPSCVAIGEKLFIEVDLKVSASQESRVVLDYAIHYQKANGTQRPKVFKWTTPSLKPGETYFLKKQHSFAVVTTRTLYPGAHAVEVFINGESLAKAGFTLQEARR